jgi:hypothetical protein
LYRVLVIHWVLYRVLMEGVGGGGVYR